MLKRSSLRWGYLAPKVAIVLVIVSVTVPRILGGATGGTAAGPWIAVLTGVAIVLVVIVALLVRRATNDKLRSVRVALAATHPGGAFVVFKTETASVDVKSLKPDLAGSGWRRYSRGMIVTVGEDSFTLWERHGREAVAVLSVPWPSVLTVGVARVGVAELWIDAIVVRVESGAMKVDLFLPPESGSSGLFRPAGEDERAAQRHSDQDHPEAQPDAEHFRVGRSEAAPGEAGVVARHGHHDGLQALVQAQRTDTGPGREVRKMDDEDHGQGAFRPARPSTRRVREALPAGGRRIRRTPPAPWSPRRAGRCGRSCAATAARTRRFRSRRTPDGSTWPQPSGARQSRPG